MVLYWGIFYMRTFQNTKGYKLRAKSILGIKTLPSLFFAVYIAVLTIEFSLMKTEVTYLCLPWSRRAGNISTFVASFIYRWSRLSIMSGLVAVMDQEARIREFIVTGCFHDPLVDVLAASFILCSGMTSTNIS